METSLSWRMAAIESLLFASGDPMSLDDLCKALNLTPIELRQTLTAVEERYMQAESGLQLKYFNDKVQLATKGQYGEWIHQALTPVRQQNLSQAALETLAIIAYRQPVTRTEVEAIRGVRSEYTLSVLSSLGLIEEKGRKDALGRPVLYGTTELFLRNFGLESLEKLPVLEEKE